MESIPGNKKQNKQDIISKLRKDIERAEKKNDEKEVAFLEYKLRAIEKGEKFNKEEFLLKQQKSEIAKQIMAARRSEQLSNYDSYEVHRSGKECLYRIGGLKFLFNYIRTLPSNEILDVGVGTGNASRVISQMPISSGLNFEVTALRNAQELRDNFPKEKIHITAVETLRGIPDHSLAGVIGVNSIAYSDHPDLASKRIDQALIPGGVIKATFNLPDLYETYNDTTFKPPEKFVEALKALNYDISVKLNHFYPIHNGMGGKGISNSILLAIKPGPKAPKAEELLKSDFDEIMSKAKGKRNQSPVFDINDDWHDLPIR